jgi:dihydrofolate synthase / folylpolyglutamate synthase
MPNLFATYQDDITFLESLINQPNKNYLLNINDRKIFIIRLKKFLSLVGNPQNKLKFVHIAGTSGKGSTVTILQELISSTGLKVGAYTSPYSTTAIEKIKINNKLISGSDLHNILHNIIKPALDKYIIKFPTEPISYFEAWMALALVYFAKAKCDWVILEAGLGGTHDASNVIPHPAITAITNIGLDHTEILGNTKEEIARDKAGIIKKSSKFLTTEKNVKLINIFKKICKTRQAKFTNLDNLISNYKINNYFDTPRQRDNLNLALNILDILNIKPANTQNIINNFKLPCRQEIIQTSPLVILDGAHNPDKINNLIKFVAQQKYKKLHLIIGFAEDKNTKQALQKILPLADTLYITRFLVPMRKAADLKKLYTQSKAIKKISTQIFYDPRDALKTALKSANKADLILIAGSFYIAGELRKHWISEEKILKNQSSYIQRALPK